MWVVWFFCDVHMARCRSAVAEEVALKKIAAFPPDISPFMDDILKRVAQVISSNGGKDVFVRKRAEDDAVLISPPWISSFPYLCHIRNSLIAIVMSCWSCSKEKKRSSGERLTRRCKKRWESDQCLAPCTRKS